MGKLGVCFYCNEEGYTYCPALPTPFTTLRRQAGHPLPTTFAMSWRQEGHLPPFSIPPFRHVTATSRASTTHPRTPLATSRQHQTTPQPNPDPDPTSHPHVISPSLVSLTHPLLPPTRPPIGAGSESSGWGVCPRELGLGGKR